MTPRATGYYGMADYITACENLQVSEYQHRGLTIEDYLYYVWRPSVMYDALLTQKRSLPKLRVENDGNFDLYEPSERGESDDDE